jgi:hypothetical protein
MAVMAVWGGSEFTTKAAILQGGGIQQNLCPTRQVSSKQKRGEIFDFKKRESVFKITGIILR